MEQRSPDGRFVVRTATWEARMSHWIETPTIVETATGETLLRFADPNWSLDSAIWTTACGVMLRLRKYPGRHKPGVFEVDIACDERRVRLDGNSHALEDLERVLERCLAGQRK